MSHVVLLGDSILDNGAYTEGGPDVVTQLRAHLPRGWLATLLAADGATTATLPAQVARIPRDATHLVLSIGGNDALGHVELLDRKVRTVGEAMLQVAGVVDGFRRDYAAALELVLSHDLPTLVCTIYEGNFTPADFQRVASLMASLFDDVIRRAADAGGAQVLDLRPLFTRPEHYANPIEPSSRGGEQIARAVARHVTAVAPAARSPRR